MSAEDIQQIIRRSVIDRAFAKALHNNFNEAVREYDLNAIEKAALKAMQIEFDDSKKRRHRTRRLASKTTKVRNYYRLD